MIKEELKKLRILQSLDRKIDEVDKKIRRFPDQLLEPKEKLDKSVLLLEEFKKTLVEIKEQRGKLEFDAQELREEIKKAEDRSRQIKSQKEYQASVKEISNMNQRLKDTEDAQLKAMEVIEKLEVKIKSEEESYQALKAKYDKQCEEIRGKIEELNQGIDSDRKKRADVLSGIDESLVRDYERIRVQRQGIAIVDVVNFTCLGCHMEVPPQYFNQLLTFKEIHRCLHCQRILTVPDKDDESEEKKDEASSEAKDVVKTAAAVSES